MSAPAQSHTALSCMEIKGGYRAIEQSVSTPGLDAWICSRPHEGAEGGGDVHYVSLCGGGILTRLIVADVSGHGAHVAQTADSLRRLMRRHINRKDQAGMVRALNRGFAAQEATGRFATALLSTYRADRRSLTVCNAGHPRPFWYRAARGDWCVLDATGGGPGGNLPLGLDDTTAYAQFRIDLGPGDVIVAYTDALTEAADPEGRMLGESGLQAVLESLDPGDPALLGTRLLEAVDRHREARPAADDTTLVVLRHTGEGPRPPTFGEKIDVYAKVFGLRAV